MGADRHCWASGVKSLEYLDAIRHRDANIQNLSLQKRKMWAHRNINEVAKIVQKICELFTT